MNKVEIESVGIRATDLGKLFALSAHRVRELAREGIIPAPTKGKFPLVAAVTAYVKHLKAKSDAQTIVAARRRKLQADAEAAEYRLAELQEKMVDVDEMVRRLSPWLVQARQIIFATANLTHDEQNDLIDTLGKTLDAAIAKDDPDEKEPDTATPA